MQRPVAENEKRVESISRALEAITQFSSEYPSHTVSELAGRMSISRPTARRILLTLVADGYAKVEGSSYSLTPRIMNLGFSFLSTLSVWDAAQPHVVKLSQEMNESASMAILDENEIVYVIRSPMHRGLVSLNVGSRLPAHATSFGKAILAWASEGLLDEFLNTVTLEPLTSNTITDEVAFRAELAMTRERGFALSNGEREIGVRSTAAPVVSRDGDVIAAVNISTNALKVSEEELIRDYVPHLLDCVGRINADIQFFAPPNIRR